MSAIVLSMKCLIIEFSNGLSIVVIADIEGQGMINKYGFKLTAELLRRQINDGRTEANQRSHLGAR